jgi:steroid delta-isomerase-like uncharacterized protein
MHSVFNPFRGVP